MEVLLLNIHYVRELEPYVVQKMLLNKFDDIARYFL